MYLFCFLGKNQLTNYNFYSEAIESILTGNISNWHGSSRPRTDLNHQNFTGTIYRASVTSMEWDVCTEPKDTKREHPPRHSVFTLLPSDNTYISICCRLTTGTEVSAAVWQHIQKYLLLSDNTYRSICCFLTTHTEVSAAVWQQIQKYLLLYHQTTEQLLPSGCDSPELILNTHQFMIVFLVQHKDTAHILLYSPML